MGDTGRIDVRVFIEGVEVPVIGVKVEEQLGTSPQCTIQLPFANEGREIIERSLVHVFYRDPDKIDYERQAVGYDDPLSLLGTAQFNLFSAGDPRRYKLLFWGEIAARGRLVSQGSNQLVLTALGLGNYFDYIMQYQALRGQGTFSDEERRIAGIEQTFGREGSSGRYSTPDRIVEIIRARGNNVQEGVVEIIAEFINRTNSFYTNRYALLRLSDIITSIKNDNTGDQLMNQDLFKRFIRQQISQVGYQMTIRGLLGLLGSFLFYEVVEHANPSYFPRLSRDTQGLLKTPDVDENSTVIGRAEQEDQAFGIFFKPELWWTAPPACNILFPSQYSALQETDFQIGDPTRTILKIDPGARGSRRTIAEKFFAPNLESLNQLAENVPEANQHMYLLGHERFRGINLQVVFINELARLVGRDGYESYLQSYAQFIHWRTTYASRQIYVDSGRMLPQVLVGYPAVAIDRQVGHMAPVNDPDREERLRLIRLRAALQRCLSRLRSSIRSTTAFTGQQIYLQWLRVNWKAMTGTLANSEGRRSVEQVGSSSIAVSFISAAPQSADGSDTEGQRSTYNSVEVNRVVLLQIFENAPSNIWSLAVHVIPESGDHISLLPGLSEISYQRDLDTLITYVGIRIGQVERDNALLRARIAEGEALLLEIQARLNALGVSTGEYKHFVFYVTGKVTNISAAGSGTVNTTITGSHTRTHDEDIDLDGISGDSFENIIRTGTGEFFAEIYKSDMIGNNFYLPYYGVRSLIDVGAEVQASTTSNPEVETEVEIAEFREIEGLDEFLEQCQESANDNTAEGMSVKDALEMLVSYYREVGQSSSDVNKFVTLITARPIATMFDILGSDVFEGLPQASEFGNYRGAMRDGLEPGVGFHQFAFLSNEGELDTSGLDEGESGEQAGVARTRKTRVLNYVNSLSARARIG